MKTNFRNSYLGLYSSKNVIVHVIFFWCRLLIILNRIHRYRKLLFETNKNIYNDVLNDLILHLIYNIFSYSIILESMITSNVYQYNFSILLTLHNIILSIILTQQTPKELSEVPGIIRYTLAGVYLIEMFYLLEVRVVNKQEINEYLVKYNGPSPRINKHFRIRKQMLTVCRISTSLSLVLSFFLFVIAFDINIIFWPFVVFVIMKIIAQICISCKELEENDMIRKFVIILGFIKIPIVVLLLKLLQNIHNDVIHQKT